MRNISYKYNVGDIVQIKMTFAQPSCGLASMAGIKAKVVARYDYNGPCYELEGLSGLFQETTLVGAVTEFSADEPAESSCKWYKVTFFARMSDEDIRAMNKCFFDAMNESMMIEECAGLKIEEDTEYAGN